MRCSASLHIASRYNITQRFFMDDSLLTVNEVSKLMAVARATVYKLMANGELPWHKIGKCRRVALADLQEFLRNARKGGWAVVK